MILHLQKLMCHPQSALPVILISSFSFWSLALSFAALLTLLGLSGSSTTLSTLMGDRSGGGTQDYNWANN